MAQARLAGGDLPEVVHAGVERAIGIQQSAVAAYVERLRRSRPDATPAEIVTALERKYLAAVTGSGAAVGGAAAAPGVGTGIAFALSAGETAVFLETTALFTLAVAEVHDIKVDEVERRRMLVLAMILGDGGSMLVEKIAGLTGQHWGQLITDLIPMSSITAINKALGHWLVSKYGQQRGVVVIGRIAPFGIGAAIGAAGNHAFGRMVVSASRRVFGPAPVAFPAEMPAVSAPPGAPPSIVERSSDTARIVDAPVRNLPVIEELPPAEVTEPAVTGKYQPLYELLVSRGGADRLDIGFSEIDAVVTGGLPKSSATKSWWGNRGGTRQSKAWLAAGYEVTNVDLTTKTARFEKPSS
jgi:hypothetical protein